jgi:hypothetical protein
MDITKHCDTKVKSKSPAAYICFLCLYIALNAHMLRNVSIVYLVALAGIETISLFFIFRGVLSYIRSRLGLLHMVFLMVSLVAAFQTIYTYGVESGLYSCVRFYMVVPIVPLAAIALDDTDKMAVVIKCFLGIICLGVLSVAIQYATGPISWFAEPGERAGIMRFGSILGSLPTIGGALPLAVLGALTIEMKWTTRSLVLLVLLFGVLISLSKGSIAGTALAIVLFVCMPRVKKRQGITILAIISLTVSFVLSIAGSGTVLDQARLYVAALFLEDSADRGGDVTMQQSMEQRWTELPAQSLGWLYHTRGDVGALTGGGFQMLGSALMPEGDSRYFTSHDTYVDLVLIGGIPLLIAYVWLVVRTTLRFHSLPGKAFFREAPEIGSCAFGMMLIIAITGLFSAGETYQPVVASIWCVLMGIAIRIESQAIKGTLLCRTVEPNPIQGALV